MKFISFLYNYSLDSVYEDCKKKEKLEAITYTGKSKKNEITIGGENEITAALYN